MVDILKMFLNRKRKIAIIGGGGHARVIIDALYGMQQNPLFINNDIIGYFDDKVNSKYRKIDRIGAIEDIKNVDNDIFYICGIGDLEIRKKIINTLDKVKWINVIHSSAIISKTVTLGQGIFINANAVINSQSIIKDHVIINTNSTIEHDVLIGENCHIAPGVTICGHVTINENSFIGSGTTIINKNKEGFIIIGKNNFINAGSLILHSTKDNSKIRYGN